MKKVEKGYTGRNISILSNSQAANKCSDIAKLVSDCHQSLVKLEEHFCQQVLVPIRNPL